MDHHTPMPGLSRVLPTRRLLLLIGSFSIGIPGLLLALIAIAAWLGIKRGRSGSSRPRDGGGSDTAGYFGRLRGSIALGFVGPAFLLYGLVARRYPKWVTQAEKPAA